MVTLSLSLSLQLDRFHRPYTYCICPASRHCVRRKKQERMRKKKKRSCTHKKQQKGGKIESRRRRSMKKRSYFHQQSDWLTDLCVIKIPDFGEKTQFLPTFIGQTSQEDNYLLLDCQICNWMSSLLYSLSSYGYGLKTVIWWVQTRVVSCFLLSFSLSFVPC